MLKISLQFLQFTKLYLELFYQPSKLPFISNNLSNLLHGVLGFWGFGVFWAGLGLALDNIYRKFYRTLNNAKKSFNSIFNLIFLKIIHSKKLFLKNYSFKEKFIQKN